MKLYQNGVLKDAFANSKPDIVHDLLGMIENSFDGMCIADGEGRLILVNPSLEKVTGLDRSKIIGEHMKSLLQRNLISDSAIIKALETKTSTSMVIKTKNGNVFISSAVPILDDSGQVKRVYCNLRDITELNELKAMYHEAQLSVQKYKNELTEIKKLHNIDSTFMTRNRNMKEVVEIANRIAMVDCTVLITGESGVGKGLLAYIIHEKSPRSQDGPLVTVNCAAIPDQLLESELFGYSAGAFTGARKEGKIGYFELADKGTILLDEIGDLPLYLQGKLLEVIQDRKIAPVGSTKSKNIDVRIIAATNRNLEEEVAEGNFRDDLYYRLKVIPINIPALKDRKDDIPFLIMHFMSSFCYKYSTNKTLSKDVINILSEYDWPGNVRELSNLIERLIVLSSGPMITLDDLPNEYFTKSDRSPPKLSIHKSLRQNVEQYELEVIKKTLGVCQTHEEAAHKLGISLSTLARKLRRQRSRMPVRSGIST